MYCIRIAVFQDKRIESCYSPYPKWLDNAFTQKLDILNINFSLVYNPGRGEKHAWNGEGEERNMLGMVKERRETCLEW